LLFVSLLFLSFALFLWLGIQTLYGTSGGSGLPCPDPDIRGNGFSFFPFRKILAVGLSNMGFIMLGCISSVPSSYGLLFIMQGCFCAIDIIM
jgi:hypothetical protein